MLNKKQLKVKRRFTHIEFDQAKKSIKNWKFCSQVSIIHKCPTNKSNVKLVNFGNENVLSSRKQYNLFRQTKSFKHII